MQSAFSIDKIGIVASTLMAVSTLGGTTASFRPASSSVCHVALRSVPLRWGRECLWFQLVSWSLVSLKVLLPIRARLPPPQAQEWVQMT